MQKDLNLKFKGLKPVLSIVISTWKRKKKLDKILFSLIKQNFKRNYEIIICDSNSRDGTKEIVLKYNKIPNLKINYINLENNISQKRNYGIKFAKSDNIIFLDDDCIPEKKFLRKYYNLLKNLNSKTIYCGIVKFPTKKLRINYFQYRQSRHFQNSNGHHLNENSIVTMNMGVKKKLILKEQIYFNNKLGVLGKNLNGLEDYEFGYRVIKKKINIKKCDSTIIHLDERSLKDHAKKYLVFGKYTIHNLEKVNYEACKENFFFKLKGTILVKFILKNIFLLKMMLFVSKQIIHYNDKFNLRFIFFKFVLLSYFIYGLSLKNYNE